MTYEQALSTLKKKLGQLTEDLYILSCIDYKDFFIFSVTANKDLGSGVEYVFNKKNGECGTTNMMQYLYNDKDGSFAKALRDCKVIDELIVNH